MSSKLSMEEVLAHMEERAAALRDEEAFHARQEAHHRAERELRAVELERVLASLEAFRAASMTASGFARAAAARPAAQGVQERLPPPGRLMVGRLLRLVIESPSLTEPFGAPRRGR